MRSSSALSSSFNTSVQLQNILRRALFRGRTALMSHAAVIYGGWNSLPLQSCSCSVIGPFIRIMRKPSCGVTDALRIRSAGPERGGGRGAGGRGAGGGQGGGGGGDGSAAGEHVTQLAGSAGRSSTSASCLYGGCSQKLVTLA